MEKISPKIVKDIEKSRFWSRNFCQFLEGFGIGFGEFGLGKKVSVLVSENLVSEKKGSVLVSENLVSEKSIGFGFGKFGLGKKSRFRFRRIWSRKNSLGFGFGKFGIGKKLSVWVLVKILVSSFSGEVDNS